MTHLRNDESTDLRVEVYAVAEVDGERKRLPLTIYERRAAFETDFLDTGRTSVRPTEGGGSNETFEQVTVEGSGSEWGEVRDEETDVVTTVDLRNPNEDRYADLLSLVVDRRTTIAGVTAVNDTDRVRDIPVGAGQVEFVTRKPHSVVPEWWAAHLRNGERSAVRTELDAEADVAVTRLPVDLEDRNSTLETDTLGDLNDDSARPVTSGGRTVLTVRSTSAEYVDPTSEKGTIVVRADLENKNPLESVTIREVDYRIDINDVTLADDRAPESHTLDPGERRTIEFTLTLDNSRMAAWWPTHVRRGERSVIQRSATATIETGGDAERTELGFLSGNQTVESDVLAD
ncbi:hypothetical protein BRD14_08165 [Halobacteriales archaeon SW_5_68_122]|nr:MAG: hypothetical protein BRD14_08165 [Halobacteriales archaeon SW_5_68_122]